MKLNKNEKLTAMIKEITTHKEYDSLTKLFSLKINTHAVCGMVDDNGVIHSITLTPFQADFGFASEYRLHILNTQTGDNASFDGSINSIRTILGMDTVYTAPVDMGTPHITISKGYTNIHVFKNDIVCIDVTDEEIELWVNFDMVYRDTQFPIMIDDTDHMFMSFQDGEYDDIKLACATMNNLVADLVKKLIDDEYELY